jgi:thiol-disulfide isomerase/thioredoxin
MNDKEIIKIFVIMPFGKHGSQEYRNNSNRYKNYIRPALEEYSNHVKRADEFDHLGNINKDIIEYLFSSQIVIADLTGKNANVFYELGIRHALRRNTTIPIVKSGEQIPFDVSAYRTIVYDDNEQGLVILKSDLKNKIEIALRQTPLHIDNPVYDNIGGKIVDLKKENEALSESKNNYVLECERWKKIYSEETRKNALLQNQIFEMSKAVEIKEHTIKILESNLGKSGDQGIYSKFLTVEEKYWYENILKSANNFVVLISANWFEDTHAIEMQITKIATEYDDHFILVKMYLENITALATELQIKTIPTVIFVTNGALESRFTGIQRDEIYQGVFNRIYF